MPILEAIAVHGLGWVVSPIVSRLIREGFSYVGMDVPKELMELESDVLPKLSLAIKASPRNFDIPELEPWLQRLKDAYYEAEDLLDEVEYQRLARQNRKLMVRTSHPIIKPLARFSPKGISKLSCLSLWRRLSDLKDNIKKLVTDAKTFHELLQNLPQNITTINANAPIVSVTSSQPLSKVFGRDEDRDHLVQLLLEPVGVSSKGSYFVVAIIGRGGAGKTTLAQYVFNDERVVGYFDMRIWVCLTRKLDIIEHTKEMIQSATKKDCPQQSNLDALQYNLREILLGSKHILLMLDDIWYNDREVQREEDWEQLMAPFTSVGKCSVLLTSRSKELPVALHTRHLIDLKDLNKHELVSLFKHYSHLDELGDSRLQHNLEAIGVKIVAKLARSPLATKTVASRLRTRPDIYVWRDALERANLSDTTDALMWSFLHLEEPLQRCFLHCSVFPKGLRFTLDEMVRIWRTLNLIPSLTINRDVEEIGKEYFNELLGNFFFEPISNETICGLSYRIHDSFHDLADILSRGDCYRIEDDKVMEIAPTVRHLTIAISTITRHTSSISKLKNLRSLIIFEPLMEDSSGVLKKILRNMKKLRLLKLHIHGTKELSKIVFDLKYLKMLSISSINQLPESLSKLYLLQVLAVPNSITSLPKCMSNLTNLRDLLMYDKNGKLVEGLPTIRDVGKMTSLHELREFHVRKKRGYEIQQLEELGQLRGLLKITGLENVGQTDEADKARLIEKTRLEVLHLVWSPSSNERDSDLPVIDVLQPSSNLKHLIIDGYAGARYPVWFTNSLVHNLSYVKLIWCNALEVLPSNFHSWRNLEKLTISTCPSLVFISEEDLHSNQQRVLLDEQSIISNMAPFVELASHDIDFMKSGLQRECAIFKQISKKGKRDFSGQVKVLESSLEGNKLSFGIDQLKAWWHCHGERINFIYNSSVQENQLKSLSNLRFLKLVSCNITDGALSDCLFGLISLEELYLHGIMSLTTLPSEEILENLKNLRVLRINSCWLLRSLGALHVLSSLEKLEVVFCPCLDIENVNNPSGLPSSLQSLEIHLGSIPSGILNSNLPLLNAIDFRDCHSASFLSFGHLSSLRSLMLFNCADIYFLEGTHLLSNLETLRLTKVPKLEVKESLLESWPGCRELHIDNVQLLKLLFSSDALFVTKYLILEHFQDEATTFDFGGADLHRLASVEYLTFFRCRTKCLPTSLRTTFPSLKWIAFKYCPEISSLPELSESVTGLLIVGCPVLKKTCCYNGEDWQKIARIRWKNIE